MYGYTQWVLRCKFPGCSASITVPSPIHTGRVADLEGLPNDTRKAVFLCSEFGHVALYSGSDLQDHVLGRPDPYEEKSLDLVYIEVECDDSNCESPIRVHAVWDVANQVLATKRPMSEWTAAEDLSCNGTHRVRLPIHPKGALRYYSAQMPF